jgi:uncharacterized protein (TIGR02246 family)
VPVFAETDPFMEKIFAPLQAVMVTVLLAAPLARLHAQTAPAPDPLFQTIQSLDTQLFDAFNHCDLEKFGSLFADDLEFYHDKSGLSRGRPALVEGIKNNICGKVTRELVPGTLEVYPIADYGAVEIGVHRFHHPGHETAESVGEAKFIHLWQKKDGVWKVTRVISFDHQALKK